MTATMILTEAMKLSSEERMALADELILSVDDNDDAPPELTPEFCAELERRYQECVDHPERMVSWEVVKKELDAELNS